MTGVRLNEGNGIDSGHVLVFDLTDLLSTPENSISTFSLYTNLAKENLTIMLSELASL